MKNLTLLVLMSAFFLNECIAQVPQAFKYQAVARKPNGDLYINQNMSVRVKIIDNIAGGDSVYTEIHKAGTNEYGLFSISIGEGDSIVNGIFNNIQWATGNKWIKIELDPSGGTTYTNMGTHPLLSVPYALFAGNAGADADADPTNELQVISISNDTIFLSNGGFVKLPLETIQSLSISGNQLTISGGNSVTLPPANADPTLIYTTDGF